ncbi:MAG: hypothetical protein KDD45_15495 [Bdellovibrionales bacterium]|nr:hypothetical protein [Bdellovibrionales bacterium]
MKPFWKQNFKTNANSMGFILGLIVVLFLNSCAYKIGQRFRSLPGGYQKLSIPIIKNKSFEPGAESIFVQALKEEFLRSTVLKVVPDAEAQVRLEGEIESIKNEASGSEKPAEENITSTSTNYLPRGTVLTTSYNLTMIINLKLVKIATHEVLWQSRFVSTRAYTASQVTVAGINSVNPIYNQSAKRFVIEGLSSELSNQIHNNLTENF